MEDAATLDALADSLWWSGDVEDAADVRGRAYAAHIRAHDFDQAARAAAWVSREKRAQHGDGPVPRGWLDRAAEAASRTTGSSAAGWVLVARAEATRDLAVAATSYGEAVALARTFLDADLECLALARRGVLMVGQSDPDVGLRDLNAAMAAVTAGEPHDRRTLAEVYCALVDAAEILGGSPALAAWSAELMRSGDVDLGPLAGAGSVSAASTLSAFCGSCCGGVFLATGRLDDAEETLLAAIADLERSGLRSRCVHPAAMLADLRIVQGRLSEAAALLATIADLPESVRPLAALDMANDDPATAASRLGSAASELPELAAAALPLVTMQVDALLAQGDGAAAERAAARVVAIAARTGSPQHVAHAHLAVGRTRLVHDPATAAQDLRDAAAGFSEASMALPASRARLLLARAVAADDPGLAVAEARAARAAFLRLGATSDADEASAFLRGLGVRSSPGERDVGLLSTREREVLRLVAEGLSNPEIAQRLFISRKTAGHHVSSILAKLGLRSRTEAAAFAVVQASQHPGTE